MSGWRRITPVAEHGTSSSTRSKGRPSHQSARPRRRRRAVSASRPESRQVLAHALDPRRRDVQRGHGGRARRPLEHVTGLAARRRAGVEDALARRRCEQVDRKLRRGVLHRKLPVGETGQRTHVGRRLHVQRVGRERVARRAETGGYESAATPRQVAAHPVHPHPERRMFVVRLEHCHRRLAVGRGAGRRRTSAGAPCATPGRDRRA